MSGINSIVTVFQNFVQNQGGTLLNAILIISTIGGQSIIRRLTFSCPCAHPLNVYHSLVFIFGPTFALFIIGIMVNTTTWRLVHGSCFRAKETRPTWRTVCVYWAELIVQSSIAPGAWLFVVFLDGGYYRCLRAQDFCAWDTAPQCKNDTIRSYYENSVKKDEITGGGKVTDGSKEQSERVVLHTYQNRLCIPINSWVYLDAVSLRNKIYLTLFGQFGLARQMGNLCLPHYGISIQYCPECICNLGGADGSFLEAESQIFAWFIIIGFGLGTLLILCCTRMCDKYTLVQRDYVEMYKDIEKRKFNEVAKEHATQLAERNARAFFNEQDWTKRDWDWVSGVTEINNPMFRRLRIIAAEKSNTTMYTPLQLWNDHKGYRILAPQVLECDETCASGVIVPQESQRKEE